MSNLNIILAIVGAWFVAGALIIDVRANIISKLYFKVIPFAMGGFCFWYAFHLSGLI